MSNRRALLRTVIVAGSLLLLGSPRARAQHPLHDPPKWFEWNDQKRQWRLSFEFASASAETTEGSTLVELQNGGLLGSPLSLETDLRDSTLASLHAGFQPYPFFELGGLFGWGNFSANPTSGPPDLGQLELDVKRLGVFAKLMHSFGFLDVFARYTRAIYFINATANLGGISSSPSTSVDGSTFALGGEFFLNHRLSLGGLVEWHSIPLPGSTLKIKAPSLKLTYYLGLR